MRGTTGVHQKAILAVLEASDVPLSIPEIARRTGYWDRRTRAAVYRPVHALAKRGLVEALPGTRKGWRVWRLAVRNPVPEADSASKP